jgi:hypothetical protein
MSFTIDVISRGDKIKMAIESLLQVEAKQMRDQPKKKTSLFSEVRSILISKNKDDSQEDRTQ